MRWRTWSLLLLSLLVVCGCQIDDPYAEDRGETTPASTPVSTEGDEPATLPGGVEQTAARFAEAWIDWTSNESAEARGTLAELADPSLEEELLREAESSGALSESRVSARVEGVLPKGGGRALVVTKENVLLASGGGQAQYAVYLARLRQAKSGWEVVEWTPVL
jgi:hypothetical protein